MIRSLGRLLDELLGHPCLVLCQVENRADVLQFGAQTVVELVEVALTVETEADTEFGLDGQLCEADSTESLVVYRRYQRCPYLIPCVHIRGEEEGVGNEVYRLELTRELLPQLWLLRLRLLIDLLLGWAPLKVGWSVGGDARDGRRLAVVAQLDQDALDEEDQLVGVQVNPAFVRLVVVHHSVARLEVRPWAVHSLAVRQAEIVDNLHDDVPDFLVELANDVEQLLA